MWGFFKLKHLKKYDKNTNGTPQVSCVRKQPSPVRRWGYLENLGPSSSPGRLELHKHTRVAKIRHRRDCR